MKLRWFPDGDYLTIVRDDFQDLMNSPALFIPMDSPEARMLQNPKAGLAYIAEETVYEWCYQLGRRAGQDSVALPIMRLMGCLARGEKP